MSNSNDNTASKAARAASHAGKKEQGRLNGQDQLGASDRLSAAVLTQRMLEAVISASASAHAARAASIVAGMEAEKTQDGLRRLRRTILPLVASLAALGGVGVGLFISHLT